MKKEPIVKIRLVSMGSIPKELSIQKLQDWKSRLFAVYGNTRYAMNNMKPDLSDYQYSDKNILDKFPSAAKVEQLAGDGQSTNLIVYLVDIPLQDNYFSRVFDKNRIVLTFYDVKKTLKEEQIPFENYVLKRLYMYSLLYLSSKNNFIEMKDEEEAIHFERNGCVFDGCYIKEEFIDSCVNPIICNSCIHKLHNSLIEDELLEAINVEMKRITRGYYHGFVRWLQSRPLSYIVVSAIVSAIMGGLVSLLVYAAI